jgi:exonuclease SbcC
LLAELLKIDHLRALSTKAAEVAKVLARQLGVVQQDLTAFSGKRERVDQTRNAIAMDVSEIAKAREQRTAAQAEIATLTQQHAVLVAKQGENGGAAARLGELGARRNELRTSLDVLEVTGRRSSNGCCSARRRFVTRSPAMQRLFGNANPFLAPQRIATMHNFGSARPKH